jgi:uncharacterized protein GlcG (DUF336 family)
MPMSLALAQKLTDAAHAHATQRGVSATVCVMDVGGNVVLKARQDGASLISLQISEDKAYTAVSLGMPSDALQEHMEPGKFLFGFNTPRVLPLGGGFPLHEDGTLIGSIGISGPTTDDDLAIAAAALKAQA